MIYDFEKGHVEKYFRDINVKKRDVDSVFKVIQDVDFTKNLDMGKAVLDSKGAYVIDENGERQAVYFYKSPYWFYHKNHNGIQYPKFHILECETIRSYSGFRASNTKTVSVRNANRYEGDRVYELELKLCGNCRKLANNYYETTAEFYDALEQQHNARKVRRPDIKVDLDGYTLDWSIISKRYRKEMKFSCERCSIKLSTDRKFLHVHHKNHDKLDNRPSNLECLCVLCHKHSDAVHEHNFMQGKMKKQLDQFLKKHYDRLENCSNPYVTLYNKQK
jgi:hypothetical protein